MIESEIGNARRIQFMGQRKLFRGIAAAEKAVGADHKRRASRRRKVEPAPEQQPFCGKFNRLADVDAF
jgi:hypothetical protein